TDGAGDDFEASCQPNTGDDRTYRLNVPGNLVSLTLDTNGSPLSDTVLSLKEATCSATDLACDDDDGDLARSKLELGAVPAGTYFVVVDGYANHSGSFKLNVSGTIEAGQACLPAQIATGLFACAGGGACTGGICQAP